MGINERVIDSSDPGAIPGGSTNTFRVIGGRMGPISFDGRFKGDFFPSEWAPVIGPFSNCER